MDRNEFMKSLEQHYPDDMNDEQLDALEQFSFKLFDAGYAEDKVDILLANEGLNKLLTSNHDEHKARFLKLSELKQRNAELESQLVEVNNNRTGVAPCARFCEALASKKMFDNLQTRNAELMAQVQLLREVINHYQEGQVPSDNAMDELIHRASKTPAQCLAEVRAQAVEDAAEYCCIQTMTHLAPIVTQTRLRIYANQLRQQAKDGKL